MEINNENKGMKLGMGKNIIASMGCLVIFAILSGEASQINLDEEKLSGISNLAPLDIQALTGVKSVKKLPDFFSSNLPQRDLNNLYSSSTFRKVYPGDQGGLKIPMKFENSISLPVIASLEFRREKENIREVLPNFNNNLHSPTVYNARAFSSLRESSNTSGYVGAANLHFLLNHTSFDRGNTPFLVKVKNTLMGFLIENKIIGFIAGFFLLFFYLTASQSSIKAHA